MLTANRAWVSGSSSADYQTLITNECTDCRLNLNLRRRTKKRVPVRDPLPLSVPDARNRVWSADFMSDALYNGVRFRTFNVLDDFNREALAIEIDSLEQRLVRVFEQLKRERGLPDILRTDNGPEFLGEVFVSWCRKNGVMLDYIEPGKPNRHSLNASIGPTEAKCTWLFRNLVRSRNSWMLEYEKETMMAWRADAR